MNLFYAGAKNINAKIIKTLSNRGLNFVELLIMKAGIN